MLWIAGALLAGWVLNLFGFDNVVIGGMQEIFGIAITHTGYYFLFGLIGMIKFILRTPPREPQEIPSWSKAWEDSKKAHAEKQSKRNY